MSKLVPSSLLEAYLNCLDEIHSLFALKWTFVNTFQNCTGIYEYFFEISFHLFFILNSVSNLNDQTTFHKPSFKLC